MGAGGRNKSDHPYLLEPVYPPHPLSEASRSLTVSSLWILRTIINGLPRRTPNQILEFPPPSRHWWSLRGNLSPTCRLSALHRFYFFLPLHRMPILRTANQLSNWEKTRNLSSSCRLGQIHIRAALPPKWKTKKPCRNAHYCFCSRDVKPISWVLCFIIRLKAQKNSMFVRFYIKLIKNLCDNRILHWMWSYSIRQAETSK